MIISHKHKFVFVKLNKTAGTSLEMALVDFCRKDDIMTLSDHFIKKTKFPKGDRDMGGFNSHVSIKEIIESHPETKDYFKFCVERHPAERTISLYYHFRGRKFNRKKMPNISISSFIKHGYPTRLHERGYKLYTIDDEVAVDKVFYYEDLNGMIKSLKSRLGIGPLRLGKARVGQRKDKRSYKEILNKQDLKGIKQLFKKEINLHGYKI